MSDSSEKQNIFVKINDWKKLFRLVFLIDDNTAEDTQLSWKA